MSHYLYRLRDSDGSLLYIGCSAEPWGRVRAHNLAQPWGEQIASVATEGPFLRAEAFQREREAIASESPRFNVTHNPDPEIPIRPTYEAVAFVGDRVCMSRAGIRRAMHEGELPMEPTDADVYAWAQKYDARYHAYPCPWPSCHCRQAERSA